MKTLFSSIVILGCLTLIYCQNNKNKTAIMEKIDMIQIKSVDFSIMTILSVECDKFEEYFNKYRIVSITDKAEIDELLSIIEGLELIDSTYSKKVDTRAKINLVCEDDVMTICIGNLSLFINNNIYKTPQALIEYIEKAD